MSNQIAWIYGPSAAGKETFINHITVKKPRELLEKLRWWRRPIIVCRESLDWVVQAVGDGNEQKRKGLVEIIKRYDREHSGTIILVKGQDLDFENRTHIDLKDALPKAEHNIIYLITSLEEMFERLRIKPWWTEDITPLDCYQWARSQTKLVLKAKSVGFEVTTLDSSENLDYPLLTFPVPSFPPLIQ